jgi:DNA-binding transcriptional regulator WhiA
MISSPQHHYWKLKISCRYQHHRQKNYNYPVGTLKPTEKLPHRQKYVKLPVGTHVTDRKITYTQEKYVFFLSGVFFPVGIFSNTQENYEPKIQSA